MATIIGNASGMPTSYYLKPGFISSKKMSFRKKQTISNLKRCKNELLNGLTNQ